MKIPPERLCPPISPIFLPGRQLCSSPCQHWVPCSVVRWSTRHWRTFHPETLQETGARSDTAAAPVVWDERRQTLTVVIAAHGARFIGLTTFCICRVLQLLPFGHRQVPRPLQRVLLQGKQSGWHSPPSLPAPRTRRNGRFRGQTS